MKTMKSFLEYPENTAFIIANEATEQRSEVDSAAEL